MERISVSALRAGMVLPILQFGGPAAFATLVEPDAYYVVTAEHPENSMRQSLAHRNPACARTLPLCLTFEARSTPYSVVIRTAVVPDFASNRCIGHNDYRVWRRSGLEGQAKRERARASRVAVGE